MDALLPVMSVSSAQGTQLISRLAVSVRVLLLAVPTVTVPLEPRVVSVEGVADAPNLLAALT